MRTLRATVNTAMRISTSGLGLGALPDQSTKARSITKWPGLELEPSSRDLCAGGCRHGRWLLILWAFRRGERDVAYRSIGQERFGFAGRTRSGSSLDELATLIDWQPVAALLDLMYSAAKGEPAWPPLAIFKALLLSIWYDLSDMKLADALDDRTSFRRFCGFSSTERRRSAQPSCASARCWSPTDSTAASSRL
ncbi:transposase [Sphingobium sp. OAS761]|uniref:transposase n=1 Tax=Sphingobium sp. OAS761 TaxID=2817901 RepID=UPI00345F1688